MNGGRDCSNPCEFRRKVEDFPISQATQAFEHFCHVFEPMLILGSVGYRTNTKLQHEAIGNLLSLWGLAGLKSDHHGLIFQASHRPETMVVAMKSWMYFSPFGTPLLKTWMLVIIPVFWMVSLYIFTSTTTGRWSRVKLWKRVKIQGLNTSSLLAFAEGIPVKEPKKNYIIPL